jgi:hypothetical protein
MNYVDSIQAGLNLTKSKIEEADVPHVSFTRSAQLASILLDRSISPYDVAIILACDGLATQVQKPESETAIPKVISALAMARSVLDVVVDGRGEVQKAIVNAQLEKAMEAEVRDIATKFAPKMPTTAPLGTNTAKPE